MSNGMLRLVVSFASVDKLSGSLKGIVGLAQSGSQRLAGMKREARDLDGELRGVRAELGRSTGNVTALLERERSLEAQIASTNREMGKQVRLLKIQSNVDRMHARGDALKSSGAGNVAGGAGILTSLYLASRGGMDFQSGMTDIALKANLSAKATAQMQGNIIAAARAAKQLPENMRAGVDVLAGFGMSPQQATMMIGSIGRVATAYRAQIPDLAAASYANFSNLKVPIAQNARALEIMAAAGNAGAFEIKDMAQYFPSLTAQAQAFGQKGVAAVADLAAAAQIARKGTGDSASAATNLENLLAKINTEETIKKFGKMGVDLPAALKKAYAQGKTPLEAIAEITNRTLGGKLDKMSFLFGDMQAQSALRPLIQNMAEYRRIRAEALASKGAIDGAFARRSQDAATMSQALIGNLQRLAITAGPILLPPLVRISEILLTVTDRVAAWMQANPRAASSIIGLVAGLGAFKIGLGALQLVFGSLLGPMGTAFGFLLRNGPLLGTVFGGIRTAALFLTRGVAQAGMIMLANPMVAVIVAIVAALGFAGYMVYKHWGTIKGAFMGAMGWLRGLAGQFMSYGRALLDGLIGGITSRIAAVKSMILGIAGKVAGWFRGVLGIRSPSRVFMGFGGHIGEGLAIGIDRSSGGAIGAAARMAQGIAATGLVTMGAAIAPAARMAQGIAATGLVTTGVAIAPAAAWGGGAFGAGGGAMSFGPVTIQIYAQPGQNAGDIAEQVRRVLQEEESRRTRAARSAYVDD
jgi:hypothetical protein